MSLIPSGTLAGVMLPSELETDSLYVPDGQAFVYFLINELDEVVYVGKTEHILSRLGQHASNPGKRAYFCTVAIVACDANQLDDLETYFIEQLQPPLNIAKKG